MAAGCGLSDGEGCVDGGRGGVNGYAEGLGVAVLVGEGVAAFVICGWLVVEDQTDAAGREGDVGCTGEDVVDVGVRGVP